MVVAEQILLADKTQVVVGRLRRRRAARRTHAGGSPTGRPTSSQIRAPNNCGDGCDWSEPSSRPVLWAGAALNGPWAPTAMSTKVCSCATHKFFFKCKALELYFEGLGCQVVIGPDVYFKEFLSATHPLSAGLYT